MKILLNHDHGRVLGSTRDNLTLKEDNIGLRAIAEISDSEVIQKAKDKKLQGWSFGFVERRSHEDEAGEMKRRYIEDLDLREVSIIDDRKQPCYIATSIEMRAGEEETLQVRSEGFNADYIGFEDKKKPIDYSEIEKKIKDLKGEK